MSLTIDIYESQTLNFNARRAVRRISPTTQPTVRNVGIKLFNWGNLESSSITLDESDNIRPRNITYIVVRDSRDQSEHHYYVVDRNYISQQRWDLMLSRNAWANINTSQRAFIEKSATIANSVLNYRPEKGLTLNKIKSREILVHDQFGAAAWGILYLNKTTSPLSVALSDINYSIVGTEIPASPDALVPTGSGTFQSYYRDYNLLSTPSVPSSFLGTGRAKTFTRTVSNATINTLPTGMNTRWTSVGDPISSVSGMSIGSTFTITRMIAYGSYETAPVGDPFGIPVIRYFARTMGGNWTATVQVNGNISVTGSAQSGGTTWSWTTAQSSSNYATHIQTELNRSHNSGQVCLVWGSMAHSTVNTWSSFQTATTITNRSFTAFTVPAAPAAPTFTTNPALTAGIYRETAGGQPFNFTFNDTTDNSITTQNFTAARVNVVTGMQRLHNWNNNGLSGTWSVTVPRTRQVAVRGARFYDTSSTVRDYPTYTITGQQITLSGTPTTTTFNLEDSTDATFQTHIDANIGNATFVGIGNNTTFQTSNLNISTGNFITQGLAQQFVEGNVTYIFNESHVTEGFYEVNGVTYQVTPSTVNRTVSGDFNYNINVPGMTTNNVTAGVYRITQTTAVGTSSVQVNLTQTHIGTPVVMPNTIDCVLDADTINSSTIISEPYAIIALPLFDLKYMINGTLYPSNTLQNQKIFYDFIRTYSGTGQVADAQIIPYAPEIFKTFYHNDSNGVYVDMSSMQRIGAKSDGTPLGSMPFVVLDNSNINVEYYCNLNPYTNRRKEYTTRQYRLASPNFDSIFEWNYYDFNNEVTNWGAQHNNADTRIDISITLKPFNIYMHACPYIRDNTLMGTRNFRDFRGLVCGSAIFQASMSSSAFETYKRQNTMYEQIQQRQVGTLQMMHDTEVVNDTVAAVMGTLQGTFYGSQAGAQVGGIWQDIFGGAGGVAGGIAGGVAAGAAYAVQGVMNAKNRSRERDDLDFYYQANLANIKAQPDTLNRVSSFNQTVLLRFAIVLEQYACKTEEVQYYDNHVETFGHDVGIVNDLQQHLINGRFIKGYIINSDLPPHIHRLLNEDLQKGVYFYEQV